MDLKEFCSSLSKKDQIVVGIKLAGLALPVWEKYIGGGTSYTESVVGLRFNVPRDLLEQAVLEAEKVNNSNSFHQNAEVTDQLKALYEEISNHVVSIQDNDFLLPQPAEKVFYAVYNLLGSMIPGEFDSIDEPRRFVSFNQSIEAIVTGGILTFDEVAKKIDWV